MSKFTDYQEILFKDQASQAELVNAVKDKGYAASNFAEAYENLMFKCDEIDFQKILAPFLRVHAIKHLREGSTAYVTAVRQEYDLAMASLGESAEPGDAKNFSEFLTQQGRPYVYASDLEAGALAEILGVTFACTRTGKNNLAHGVAPFIYYRSSIANAPVMHLYNKPGDHFFVTEGIYSSTFGDGSCLYNGFAQIMRQFILEEAKKETTVEYKCYANQAKILALIQNLEPVSVTELVARVRAQHPKNGDEVALGQALVFAEQELKLAENPAANFQVDKPSSNSVHNNLNQVVPKEFDAKLLAKKEKFLNQIVQLEQQSDGLKQRGYDTEAQQAAALAANLRDKTNSFYEPNNHYDFITYKNECMDELSQAQIWAKHHRGCKQVILDILQTLSVIGAILGGIQLCVLGRYSLFPVPTKSSSLIGSTQQILMNVDP